LEQKITQAHLNLLTKFPDTHIARRCGLAEAEEVSRRAAAVLAGANMKEFDAWLRADGHRRNPGSAADLVMASLFVALRDGKIDFPILF
jgi:triphosphoribosyl-dephospho-CoA synthase